MSWAKVDDKLFAHPKFLALSLAARGLWVTALSYTASLERDGWFPDTFLAFFGPAEATSQLVNEILSTSMWIREHDGYRFHDYLQYNVSQKQIASRRKIDRKRKRGSGVDSERIPRGVRTDPGSGRDGCSKSVLSLLPESGSGAKTVPGFDRFWAVYPRHEGKKAARAAWAKLRPDESLIARMLETLAWQREHSEWQRDDGRFVPYPATWLNGGRWEDERPAATPLTVSPRVAKLFYGSAPYPGRKEG